jgi:hypothetical protein
MPKSPRPFEIFTKPKHPRYNWHTHDAKEHAAALLACISHDERVRANRALQGFPSLRRHPHPKVRFSALPRRERPLAEAELARRINEFIATHGHPPSQAKVGSLTGNVTYIFKYVRTGKFSAWRRRHKIYRRMLDRLDAAVERRDTPAAPPAAPRKRSSWNPSTGA